MRAAARTLAAAERAAAAADGGGEPVAWRTGMLKPAVDLRQARDYCLAAEMAAAANDDAAAWLGGAPPRALATADEARALLPDVAARDFAEYDEETDEEEQEQEDQRELSPADAERRARQRRKQRQRRERQRQRGASSSSSCCSALYVPSGITLHPGRYMQSLWRACQDVAAAKGGTAELRTGEAFSSIAELVRRGSPRPWLGVVVAAGAAVGALPEARAAGLASSLQLARGWSLDLCDTDYPAGAPSLLGKPYLASRGGRELVVGAAAARAGARAPTAQEVLAALGGSAGGGDEEDEDTERARRELIEGGARAWPPLAAAGGGRWRVARVREGVRAVAPRTADGAPPLLGRLPMLLQSAGSDSPPPPEVWVVAGLGARGLVYHAWLGEMAARGVLERSEAHVPAELRRWQQQQQRRPTPAD
jgi:hypothetical protein